ncbi:hypothetical protein [Mycolicibacterium sp.]|uniref:hypothetical protein n=1 Tax=Mycolicibacterium sp. TaxID=2320850 RepID=UPI0037C6C493
MTADERCRVHGIHRCTICIIAGPFVGARLPEGDLGETLGELGFKPIGYLAPGQDALLHTKSGDDDVLQWGRVLDEAPGEHVAECQDCPTTYDPKYGRQLKRELVFDRRAAAEAAALLHRIVTGHNVTVLHRQTFTFQASPIPTTLWELLFGSTEVKAFWEELALAGDCGDVERSLA